MSFANQTSLPNGQGSILQTIFTGGVAVNANRSFPEMDTIRQLRMSGSQARNVNFMLETALGYAAAQMANPSTSNRAFPSGQSADLSEKTAEFKEFHVTLEVPQNVVDAEKGSSEKYESLVAIETRAKAIVTARLQCADFYLDGTGVRGTISSAADVGTLSSTGQVDVTMSSSDTARGHAGLFEIGDIYVPKQADGTARTFTGSASETVLGLKVLSRNHRTQVVRFQIIGAAPTYTAVTGITNANLASTDVLYRVGQPSANGMSGEGPDLSSISDYDTISESLVGLETFGANDGRVCQGITYSGATAGTRYDHGGQTVSFDVLEQLLSDGEIAVGNGVMSWSQALCHPLTRSQLLKEHQTDRRVVTAEDNKRGSKFLAFQHEDQTVRLIGREYVKPNRIYLPPTPKGNDRQKPIALIGSDFKPVIVPGSGGSEWHLKATSSGYVGAFQSFMFRRALMLCTYPAAILTAHNFSNS